MTTYKYIDDGLDILEDALLKGITDAKVPPYKKPAEEDAVDDEGSENTNSREGIKTERCRQSGP